MKIRTRLFLGTTLLVLALVLVQWWLQRRQVEAIRGELARVAATVGESLVLGQAVQAPEALAVRAKVLGSQDVFVKQARRLGTGVGSEGHPKPPETAIREHQEELVELTGETGKHVQWVERHEHPTVVREGTGNVIFRKVLVPITSERGEAKVTGLASMSVALDQEACEATATATHEASWNVQASRIELTVQEAEGGKGNVLIVASEPHREEIRVPVDLAAASALANTTMHRGLLASGVLLLAGMGGAAIFAHRVTRPLGRLMTGVEAVGRGEIGTQVPGAARGEIGELMTSFNTMSGRLAALERERETWRAREHLAELGDLARGLAHTLRNPLNTLGLAVDELAGRSGDEGQKLATTARHQIRRIDRWLLSFLSLGANGAAGPEPVDLEDLARSVVLEAAQEGHHVELQGTSGPVLVQAVPGALRAALSNLVENALQASPPEEAVEVVVSTTEEHASISVRDRGPGLPEAVREKLFSPHVTTKVGGAGMGLFLARQLVGAGNGGTLELADREGGGTEATMTLAQAPPEPETDEG